jgi:fatty acid desaturase
MEVMMNISVVIITAALCFFALALWSVKSSNRQGVAINLALFFVLALTAFVVHPLYSEVVKAEETKSRRVDIQLEAERVTALNDVLGGPENTLKYMEYTKN